MPRYFFHLLHPERDPVRDEEGSTFEDDAAAKREGMVSLGELIKEASYSEPVAFCVSVQIVREGFGIIDVVTGHLAIRTQP